MRISNLLYGTANLRIIIYDFNVSTIECLHFALHVEKWGLCQLDAKSNHFRFALLTRGGANVNKRTYLCV